MKQRTEVNAAERAKFYSRIAAALAQDYFRIYYVDVETDEFIEYSSQTSYLDLQIEQKGKNFFKETRESILRVVHEGDRDKLCRAMNKKYLLEELSKARSFSVIYRLVSGDEFVYVSMKAIRPFDDERHLVVGIRNIDAQIKREQRYRQALGTAREMVNRDALTGVKSKHAYAEAEKELNVQIAEKRPLAFAIAVCDVNGLKAVNDRYGHQAGDEYIRSACEVVCKTFKRSPVFRVGGDEFAVILQGTDYRVRAELLADLRSKNWEYHAVGRASVAAGMADYDPEKDVDTAAVFYRADADMYREKKAMKAD